MLNKVMLIGNLGADPELRHTPGGQDVCDLRLATNEKWKDKEGNKQEKTEWHRVVFWGKPAQIIKEYCTKGQMLYVEGRIQTRSWDDKEGVKKYMTEIVGSEFKFLGGKGDKSAAPREGGPPMDTGGAGGSPDDDIPF